MIDQALSAEIEEGGPAASHMPCCPFCEHAHVDDFEVLEPNVLNEMRCERCRKVFAFAIMECDRCANEQAFSWATRPAEAALALLTCPHCMRSFRYADAEDVQESTHGL